MNEIAGYHILSKLGTGARSTIYAVQDKDGQVYALKHVARRSAADQRFVDQAISEHEIASKFDHPSLRRSIKLMRSRTLLRVNEVHALMELIDGQPLSDYEPASMTELCEIFIGVAQGLKVMHEAGYVHADIKPNNIMVVNNDGVKIIDFGQSCEIGSVKPRIQGTPDYIAPEQVMKLQITPQTDVFNLGASLYHKLVGKPIPTLIPSGNVGGLVMKQKLTPPVEINDKTPPALSSLVLSCVEQEPARRPKDMAAVLTRLEIALRQSEQVTANQAV